MPGPLPKDPATRARKNPERSPFQLVEVPEIEQPDLPKGFPYDGRRIKWPTQTVEWWEHWRESPLSQGFTVHDWDYLMDTAVLHAMFWLGLGGPRVAGEIRQRVAKFGATPADRARLRLMFVTADKAEETKSFVERVNSTIPTQRRLTVLHMPTASDRDDGEPSGA